MALGDNNPVWGQHKVSGAEAAEHQATIFAKRVCDIPNDLQERHAYDGSNQVEYSGYAPRGLAEGTDGWMLHKYTWSGGNMTTKQVAFGNWTNRASESYT